jgi:hypothetical protein
MPILLPSFRPHFAQLFAELPRGLAISDHFRNAFLDDETTRRTGVSSFPMSEMEPTISPSAVPSIGAKNASPADDLEELVDAVGFKAVWIKREQK